MSTVVVATTLHAYVTDQNDTCLAWLYGAERLRNNTAMDVKFFAALETDARGLAPFAPVLDRLAEVAGDYWTFSFDDGATEIGTGNRLRRITQGQNLCSTYALDAEASHMLFMAADCQPDPMAIDRLVEVDWPVVGMETPTYCLHGPAVYSHPDTGKPFGYPVEQHMPTAASVMLTRTALKTLHWRYDTETGMTDDPCLNHDAIQLGWDPLVRKDVVGRHFPEAIGPIETRGHDMRVYR